MTTIKSIRICGMHNVVDKTYNFSDAINYFVGPNGAGKSTILNAIQLALLGYIPGTAKQLSAIMKHANGPTMSVTLTLSKDNNDITIQRSWMNTGKSVKSSCVVTPSVYSEDHISSLVQHMETPIFNFSDFVSMTANKMKDWFIEYLPSVESEINWNAVLTNAVINTAYYDKDSIAEIIKNPAFSIPGVFGVREVNAFIKSTLSFKKSELARQTATIQSLIHFDDDTSSYDVDALQAENAEMKKRMDAVRAYEKAVNNNSLVADMTVPYTVKYDSIEDDPNYDANVNEYTAIKTEDYAAEIRSMETQILGIESTIKANNKIIKSGGICPYTSTQCEAIVQKINALAEENEASKRGLADLKKAHDSLVAKQNELKSRKYQLNLVISIMKDQYNKKAEFEAKKAKMFVPVPDIDQSWIGIDYMAIIDANNDKIAKVIANKKYDEMNETLVREKYNTEMTIECLKIWEKLTGPNGLQSELSVKPFVNFADTITNNLKLTMGQEYRAKFFVEQSANSFSFGIERNDGIYMPFDLLSSGEKCMYALALMMSLEQISEDDLKLIIVDDMFDHLDDANIVNMFNGIENSLGIQFVFAGVKPVDSKFTQTLNK